MTTQSSLKMMFVLVPLLFVWGCGDDSGTGGHDATVEQDGLTDSDGSPGVDGAQEKCGNSILDPGEECDDGNGSNNDACLNSCLEASCGDGFVENGVEECDDGNTENTDNCVEGCRLSYCGDGFVRTGFEECDDGNADNDDACLEDCVAATCGDGFVQAGVEECDDGNTNNDDACPETCQTARCGDGFVQVGEEECDDGNADNDDACLEDCVAATCGDGFVQTGVEECDDGNTNNDDACLENCVAATCGDGYVQTGVEQCDEGAQNGAPVLGACGSGCLNTSRFEHVLSMSTNGTVLQGDWNDAYTRIVDEMQECRVRFDDRLVKPLLIEYETDLIRFDFQSLSAWHNAYEAYAFVELHVGNRAGLGANYRRGHSDEVWKKDADQHSIDVWNEMNVDVYCERASAYQHVASFDSSGQPTFGTWDELYQTVVDRAAKCKVRVDNRIGMPPHVEHVSDRIDFDLLGLSATAGVWNAYAFVEIENGVRAGLGSNYRRGLIPEVSYHDRDQHSVAVWNPDAVEVFCRDDYSEEFVIDAAGGMVSGSWVDLYTMVVDEGRDCRVAYDNRISDPQYTEYESGILSLEFHNLHAWHTSGDVYALIEVNHGNETALYGGHRRSNWDLVWQKTADQHAKTHIANLAVTIRCESEPTYRHVLTLDGDGNTTFSSWNDFYGAISGAENAYECKLRLDNRVTMPLSVEHAGTGGDLLLFDYASLAGRYSSYDGYASTVVQAGAPTGMAGSYRRGHIADVWKKDRQQHSINAVTAFPVVFLCR
jgi:cysteine-rich repeat protein